MVCVSVCSSVLYGCETWYLNNTDEVAWNNAFRKSFNGYWRESVKPLLDYCKCLSVMCKWTYTQDFVLEENVLP